MNIKPLIADELRKPAWFFVHTSNNAIIKDKVLLMPFKEKIFGFTNHLYYRSFSYMDAKEFTSLWSQKPNRFYSFNNDPPWAVLSWVQGEDIVSLEFKIKKASLDSSGENISYLIENLKLIPFLPIQNSYSLFIEANCEPAGLNNFFLKPDCDCVKNCDKTCRTMCWK